MRTTLSLIALAALAAPALVAAQPAEEIVTVRIDTADIDVTTSEGRAELEARIESKLRMACTIKSSRYGYNRPVRDQACLTRARADALVQVQSITASQRRGGRQVAAN
ncbi:MAG: UrcA family protein [Pseudomonadota bacterium]